jgi:hypothetical protein
MSEQAMCQIGRAMGHYKNDGSLREKTRILNGCESEQKKLEQREFLRLRKTGREIRQKEESFLHFFGTRDWESERREHSPALLLNYLPLLPSDCLYFLGSLSLSSTPDFHVTGPRVTQASNGSERLLACSGRPQRENPSQE